MSASLDSSRLCSLFSRLRFLSLDALPCVDVAEVALEPLPEELAALAAFLSLEILPPLPVDGCLDPLEAVAPVVSLAVVVPLELLPMPPESVTVSFRRLELHDKTQLSGIHSDTTMSARSRSYLSSLPVRSTRSIVGSPPSVTYEQQREKRCSESV